MSRIIRKHSHGHGGHGGNDSSEIKRGHLTDHMEYRELSFKAINQFMIGLAGVVVFSYLSMYGMMMVFESEFEKRDPAPSPVAETGWPTPTPDVQAAPHVDLVVFQQGETALLDSGSAGTMPINQAMQEVVAEGLPWQQVQIEEEMTASEEAQPETPEAEQTPAEGNGH